jgi:hypothetical protein
MGRHPERDGTEGIEHRVLCFGVVIVGRGFTASFP